MPQTSARVKIATSVGRKLRQTTDSQRSVGRLNVAHVAGTPVHRYFKEVQVASHKYNTCLVDIISPHDYGLSFYTTTSTVLPADASTTQVLSISILTGNVLSTSTTTLIVTDTATVAGATPTSYAACSPNNIISTYQGQPINADNFGCGFNNSFPSDSAYGCCVSCQTEGGCAGTIYVDGTCLLADDCGTCDGSLLDAEFAADPDGTPITISNGPYWQVGQLLSD
jgi:hypothetical protein